jgi:hypothetical protein
MPDSGWWQGYLIPVVLSLAVFITPNIIFLFVSEPCFDPVLTINNTERVIYLAIAVFGIYIVMWSLLYPYITLVRKQPVVKIKSWMLPAVVTTLIIWIVNAIITLVNVYPICPEPKIQVHWIIFQLVCYTILPLVFICSYFISCCVTPPRTVRDFTSESTPLTV